MASGTEIRDDLHNAVHGKVGNYSFVCLNAASIGSRGLWHQESTLHFSTPLLLLQLFVSTITTMFFDAILLPLGQSMIVSQLLAGLLFGPSLLGHHDYFGRTLFPPRGSTTFETLSTFGLMFFIFVVGIKSDASMMLRPGRLAMLIGTSVMLVSLGLTVVFAGLLQTYIPMEPSLSSSIQLIASSQCLTAFPNISCILTELKILNTDLGRLAVSSSMFTDMLGMALTAVGFAVMFSTSTTNAVFSVIGLFGFLFLTLCVIKPIVTGHILKRAHQGKLSEKHTIVVFVFVLMAALISEVIGQHFVFGPLLLGLLLPEGPPLGSALADKLHYPVTKILYPTYLTASGLKTNIFSVNMKSLWIIGLVFLFSSLVKIATVMFIALFNGMSLLDAFVIGLILNARGVCELILYNLWADNHALEQSEFASVVIMLVLVTAITMPLIKYFYNPSKKLLPMKRRTIQHAKHHEGLRVLLCIHDEENVSSIVNLLEASYATEESPITATAVILVELVGRTAPMLIAHQATNPPDSTSTAGHIVNALRTYESLNRGCVAVNPYTSVSHFETMHEDVCKLALDQYANIVIIPFHKLWGIDKKFGQMNRAIREVNLKVMEMAPCTVGVLIDRGLVATGFGKMLKTQSAYNIAVIYIGGVDDVESLCYGARMAQHEKVVLKIIRILLLGTDNARERKFDNNLIDEVRNSQMGNERFTYQEEVVKDGVGLASTFRRLEHSFDLLIVGRTHQDSPLLAGLDAWSECPELGIVGDLLASPDIATTASVLVVQQQRALGGNMNNWSAQPVVIDTHFHGVSKFRQSTSSALSSDDNDNSHANYSIDINDHNSSWAISMNKD